ncbi:MAG: hypothetical protein V3U92_13060 [Cellulophaga sp.]
MQYSWIPIGITQPRYKRLKKWENKKPHPNGWGLFENIMDIS